MKQIIFILSFLVLCSVVAEAQKKKELTSVVNVNYCLPKVVFKVGVMMECTEYIPGPYSSHAMKELGMKPETAEAGQKWNIEKIEINPVYIPDEKAIYSISASGDYNPLTLNLSAEGFLAGVATNGEKAVFNENKMIFVADKSKDDKVIDITQINTYNNLKEILDTNYTFQEIDGEMKKIWDPIVRYAPKTETDIIKEAVSEIFRIRSERAKLLDSDSEGQDGEALKVLLKEFDRIENGYLSLFMGKTTKYKVKREFMCVLEKEDEAVVAFRFTDKYGVSDAKNVSAPAYLLKAENVIVPASKPVGGDASGAAVFYRVPAVGDLKLIKGKEELISFRTIIPQLGEVKKFPVEVISNEGLSLEFYPQYGSIKNIKKK